MVFQCCAINCKTNYPSNKENQDPGISLHSFPKDPQLARKWYNCLHRENFSFEQAKRAKLCSLHFNECDFITESQDTNKWRRKRDNLSRR